ncbi:hypothetical protein [Pantoea agglomerans]|uniref:hypothetical protein n=1 Tax=Enterobacter agglomerans TaxID=549 RepID=UPI0010C1F7C6|nr:hypothetical protein [Pantoea agglomerans]TKK33229.1 hypothetical protein PagCFBP13532_14505 [Pantoea agglomerans]
MEKDTGGTAFPLPLGSETVKGQEGMTLRDYFAGKAMQAWLTQIDPEEMEDMMERWAENSYEFADCMLKIRKK